ncbi:MAG TPA: cation-transporting P-type ATPase [Patescibacteria group bacterium]
MPKQTYNLTKEEIFEKFSCSEKGLSSEEVAKRLKQFGKNAVQKKRNWSALTLLKNQFNNALVWILIIAAFLAVPFHEYRDTVILLIIVFINSAIGFFQEFKAEQTLEQIRNLTSDKAIVLRDGEKIEIDASLLVPGDVVFLFAGDTVPADGYVLEGYDIFANEFIFTGESKAGRKIVGAIQEVGLPLSDMDNMVFMGSSITRGEAKALITQTGMQTELGRIAGMVTEIREEETPLQKQMRVLGRDVTILALIIAGLVLVAGHYSHMSWYDGFLFALALAVAVVPNGLPAAISVSLSLGMRRLLKDNVLAKKLNAVETLAQVTIICTDKTGTITRNELMVTHVVAADEEFTIDGQGYEPRGDFRQFGRIIDVEKFPCLRPLFKTAYLCNDAALVKSNDTYSITGDPTEGALIVAAKKYKEKFDHLCNKDEKLDENPFSSERMRMSVVYKNPQDGSCTSYVKGSPDVVLNLCTHKLTRDGIVPFTEEEKQKVRNSNDAMSKQALRVLAFAMRDLSDMERSNFSNEAEKNLVWLGMMGMIDPPRADVHKAIDDCLNSGIKVIMITGDYEITAQAIAKKVGLLKNSDAEVVNGKALDALSDETLINKVFSREIVFARITPEQKLRIATLLRKHGAIIAMTGDGVNDAPALKKADIGVAMGKIGTDVAKEAADMILMDDNFASIVKVIKEGRTIYQNLRKIVYFAFAANASEFFTAALGVLLQIPAPITAVQILAIDLGTDVLPSFSLSLEPSEPMIMKRKPFDAKERAISSEGVWRLARVGLIIAIGAVIAFILSMLRGGWIFGNKIDPGSVLYIKSTTAAYAVLSMGQMANLLQARSETLSMFALGFFKNKFAIGSIIISFGVLMAFMYVPLLASGLRMSPIDWRDWIAVALTAAAVFVFEEARKAEITNKNNKL